jgi:hypothetical protein
MDSNQEIQINSLVEVWPGLFATKRKIGLVIGANPAQTHLVMVMFTDTVKLIHSRHLGLLDEDD